MGQKFYFNGGRYDTDLHGQMPEGAIPLTDEEYEAIKDAESNGKVVREDANGRPVVIDPPPKTAEELAESERSKRGELLRASDWVVTRSIETGVPVPADWMQYRQDLRDVPQQAGFPQTIDWPTKPA